MSVETDAQSHMRELIGKQTEGDPLKELSGLAEWLEPSTATKDDMDDYEEVCLDLTGSGLPMKPFECTFSMQYTTPSSAMLLYEDETVVEGTHHVCFECSVSLCVKRYMT